MLLPPPGGGAALLLCLVLFFAGGVRAESSGSVPRSGQRLYLALGSQFPLSEAVERYQPLARYLERSMDVSLELVQIPRGSEQIRRFLQGTLDLALLDGALFRKYRSRLELLGVEKVRGSLQRRALLVVSKDSPVQSAAGLRTGVLAAVDEWDTLNTLWPLSLVGKGGKLRFLRSSSYEGALRDVILGYAGGTAIDERVYHGFLSRYPRFRGKLRVIATSPAFSNLVLVARRTLPEGMRAEMQRLIHRLPESLSGAAVLAATRTGGFERVGAGFFNPEEKLLARLDLLGGRGDPDGVPAAVFAQ